MHYKNRPQEDFYKLSSLFLMEIYQYEPTLAPGREQEKSLSAGSALGL